MFKVSVAASFLKRHQHNQRLLLVHDRDSPNVHVQGERASSSNTNNINTNTLPKRLARFDGNGQSSSKNGLLLCICRKMLVLLVSANGEELLVLFMSAKKLAMPLCARNVAGKWFGAVAWRPPCYAYFCPRLHRRSLLKWRCNCKVLCSRSFLASMKYSLAFPVES